MTNSDAAHEAGLTLNDAEWLDGFEDHYNKLVEPRIRLPRKTRAASRRTLLIGYVALASTALTALLWLLDASSQLVGLLVVITGALVVGAVQLRMSGTSLGARETRDLVVESMAELLNLNYRAEMPLSEFKHRFRSMGDVSETSITRCVDLVSGELDHGAYQSAQLMGGTGPVRTLLDGQEGQWLGIPVASIWDQYTVDGVLCHCELSGTLTTHTVSCDTRVVNPTNEAPRPPFVAARTDDSIFDERFYVLDEWPADGISWLTADVRTLLAAVAERFGPCTLFVCGGDAYLSIWMIGDAYEISSLGFALRRQAHSIAEAMRVTELLSRALANAS